MRRLLDDALPSVGETADPVPQGFGVRPANPDTAFHWLYWGRCPIVRTRDADRLVSALEQHLSAPKTSAHDQLLLRLAAGVTASGEAFLLPPIGTDIAWIDRRLRNAGAALIDAPFALVDPYACELVVEPPAIALNPGPRQRLVDHLGTPRSERGVLAGRYPLIQWGFEEDGRPAGRVPDVARLLGCLAAPTTQRGIEGAFHLVSRLRNVVLGVRHVRRWPGALGLTSGNGS